MSALRSAPTQLTMEAQKLTMETSSSKRRKRRKKLNASDGVPAPFQVNGLPQIIRSQP